MIEFYKDDPKDKVWWGSEYDVSEDDIKTGRVKIEELGNYALIGPMLISFDKKKVYNLWQDYPHNMTKEEVELFDKENPFWADFFKDRKAGMPKNKQG